MAGAGCGGNLFELRWIVGREDTAFAALVRPQFRKHDIDGDAVEPGRECAVSAKVIQLLPGRDEGALGQVLGGWHARGQTQAHRIDTADVGAIKLLERPGLAGLRLPDQVALVGARLVHKGRKEECGNPVGMTHQLPLRCRPR